MLKLLGSIMLVLVGAGAAPAQPPPMRCIADWLSPKQTIERNAWARKCGYITAKQEADLNYQIWVVQYEDACSSYPYVPAGSWCVRYAPFSEHDPCIDDFLVVGICSTH